MKKWKRKGSVHYKLHNIEPIDFLVEAGTKELKGFALGNILKYATRNLWRYSNRLEDDLNKIIHYAEILKEELCQPKNHNSTGASPKEIRISEEKPK